MDLNKCQFVDHAGIPQGDWSICAFIDISWNELEGRHGFEFWPNDGTHEAPGPAAYAGLKTSHDTPYLLIHYFDEFNSRVLAHRLDEWRFADVRSELAACLEISEDEIVHPREFYRRRGGRW